MKLEWMTTGLILACMFPCPTPAQVTPTSEWVNLWSDQVSLNTNPVPVGAIVRVYDPDGVLCGMFQVHTLGSYGLVPVYRDDPYTTGVDEGADPGDALRIEIDGFPARTTTPETPVWTYNGDVLRVDVRAEGVVPTSEWVSFWSDRTVVGDTPVVPGAVIRAYDPGGVLCGQFVVETLGEYGLMPVYRDDPTTPDFDEGAEPGDAITFTIDDFAASAMEPDSPIWSGNGDVKNVDLTVKFVPALLAASSVRAVSGAIEIEWVTSVSFDAGQMTLLRRIDGTAAERELSDFPIHQHGNGYRAVDSSVETGVTYRYRLRLDAAGGTEFLELGSARVLAPAFALLPSSPNPFRHGTKLRFDLGARTVVTLTVYDAVGRPVRHLLRAKDYPPGDYEVTWDGRDFAGRLVSAGVYFVRLGAGKSRSVRKTVLIK